VGTEHVLWALLESADSPSPPQRVLAFVAEHVTGHPPPFDAAWSAPLKALLESRCTFARLPSSGGSSGGRNGLEQQLPFTRSLEEVVAVVRQLSSGPVRDDARVVVNGLVATEFLVAALLVHGLNVAAEVLGRASRGRLTAWSVCAAINADPAALLVRRAAAGEATAFVRPDGAAPCTTGRPGFALGGALPDVESLPRAPTDTSNWLVPGYLAIGERPDARGARALAAAGVTTFVSLIGEQSKAEYMGQAPLGGSTYTTALPRGNFVHFPICDFDVPAQDALEALVLDLRRRITDAGECVFVHCRGGHGRTGTVVVPLVASLFDAADAAAAAFVVRATSRTRPSDARYAALGYPTHMPETPEQEAATRAANERVRFRSRRR
jgi:protein-tyrosine phosphatase